MAIDYMPGETIIHKLDPRTKILWITTVVVLTISLFDPIFLLLLPAALIIGTAVIAGIKVSKLVGMVKPLVPILIGFMIVNLWYYPSMHQATPPTFWLVPKHFQVSLDGIMYSLACLMKYVALIMTIRLMTLLTPIYDFILTAMKFKFPRSAGLALCIGLGYVPVLINEVRNIKESQEVRGWKIRTNNPIKKARAYAPIVIPSIRSSLRRGEQIAVAIEARGYGYDIAHRTFRRELKLCRKDLMAIMFLSALIIVGLVIGQWGLRIAMWTFTSNLLRSIIH